MLCGWSEALSVVECRSVEDCTVHTGEESRFRVYRGSVHRGSVSGEHRGSVSCVQGSLVPRPTMT